MKEISKRNLAVSAQNRAESLGGNNETPTIPVQENSPNPAFMRLNTFYGSQKPVVDSKMQQLLDQSRATRRFNRNNVIQPKWKDIDQAYEKNTSLVDCMYFKDEDKFQWNVLANDYVLVLKNKSHAQYIDNVRDAKLEVERKMRQELDWKILSMRFDRLYAIIGKDSAKRLRFYIRKYQGINTSDAISSEGYDSPVATDLTSSLNEDTN